MSPVSPAGELRMLGEPAGRIPPDRRNGIPCSWSENAARTVPTGTRALCGCEPGTGWMWGRGLEVTCPRCQERIMQEELDKNGIVKMLRKYGHTGPITRRDYIDFNLHAIAGLETLRA
jgi:hypothetical protein